MARRSNYGYEKRMKEKLKAEKKAKKREKKQEKKEGEEGTDDPMIAPIDPADLGLESTGDTGADETADEESSR